jgi:hypothetical protein
MRTYSTSPGFSQGRAPEIGTDHAGDEPDRLYQRATKGVKMTRTIFFYAPGKSEKELFAYDEYDSLGSGIYYTDDPLVFERYNVLEDAKKVAEEHKLTVYLVRITKNDDGHRIEVEEA